GSSSGGFSTAPFLGTWTITTGGTTVDCNGTDTPETDTGTLTVAPGTASQLLVTSSASGCEFKANVTSATTVSLVAGQSCVEPNSPSVTLEPNTGLFELKSGSTTEATTIVTGTALIS